MACDASAAELEDRRKRLFSGAEFQSALFYNGDSTKGGSNAFRYFSGCDIDGSYLVLRKNGGALLTNVMNYPLAKKLSGYPVKLLGEDAVRQIRDAAGSGKVGFAANEFTCARYSALKRKTQLRFVNLGERAMAVRGRKSSFEIMKIRQAAFITRKILDGLDPWECKTEEELHCRLKMLALENGAETSFEPIVSAGKNTRFPHYRAGKAKLADNVLVDFGVKLNGYCGDLTRCYFKKSGMNEEKTYEKCHGIFDEILYSLQDCERGSDVSELGRKLMKERGLPDLAHAIGHGIGMEVHEYPHLGRKSGDSLEASALAIEPAAYLSNYGVRYEDMVANFRGKWQRI
ncbi:MAG: M24 family metallopeptidase [Candidatus Micrarchaeia archaeon]